MAVQAGQAGTVAQNRWIAANGAALAVVLAANALSGGHHWWANFVLFPSAALAAVAVPLLRRDGGRAAFGYVAFCVAAIVFTVGLLLLFGVMHRGWPLMIIFPALAIAGSARWRATDPSARAAHHTVVGLALLGVVLGLTFLARDAGLVGFGGVHWWGFFMIAAGGIGIGNGLSLLRDLRDRRDPRGYALSAMVLFAGLGAATVLIGLRELFRLSG